MIRLVIKGIGFFLFTLILIFGCYYFLKLYQAKKLYSSLGSSPSSIIEENFTFRDLNKNGRLDVYEDFREPIDKRAEDLLNQMTIEEKIGQMFITMIGMGRSGGHLDVPPILIDSFDDPLIEFGLYFSEYASQFLKEQISFVKFFNILYTSL